jgi:nitroimidazol reductase NimA-like FMN-containing flavoprotein (pyridoxamine 5'-phosphate oxidase superfamily)
MQTLETLSVAECLELLGRHHFGRLAFAAHGLPAIVPVNYVFEEPSIIVRSDPGEKLSESHLTIVAFEIDGISDDHRSGWSVMARGPAFDITDSVGPTSAHLRTLAVEPWAPGERAHWLKILAREVSGRRFGP